MTPPKKPRAIKLESIVPHNSGADPIAIIGIGCRYPGASNPVELWQSLVEGREEVGPYPGDRFAELDHLYEKVSRKPGQLFTDRGGFLKNISGFDSQFFEISPRESIYVDPQHRLLLEVALEALEDAGQVQETYDGSATGVYTGLWTSEYETRLYESGSDPDFYSVTGCGRHSASGRLSFTFGFQGPSITVDSACSSSLVAVHMACQALLSGEIDMALAGGANLILGPEISELFTKAKMLSPDGRCKFGDASADGFVRSEGAGIVVLKRLSKAVADKNPIYAVIRGGAVNNDGRSSGLLVTPSREGQREMLHAAWKSAGIGPADIRYIEMHGTGTSVGDPVEIEAVGASLAAAGISRSCVLGSIKTNIGHTESAAGVAGLIKAALVLKHRLVPPSLHFKVPNPKIAWDKIPVQVAAEAFDLSGEPGPILAGVNSFGITGTNAHVILEEAERQLSANSQGGGPYLLPVSARSQEALQALLSAHFEQMETVSDYPIRDVCYTASVRRNHHEYRAAIVGEDIEGLRENLAAAVANEDCDQVIFDHVSTGENKVVFVAPGQGSQWLGMAGELFDRDAVFRQAFEQCDSAIAAETGWRLADRVLGPDAERYLSQIDVIQPALFAMSVALAAVWQSWGVEPDAVIGHSMGEVAAAHIAGILSLRDAVAVICRRSRLMKTLRGAGSMASVELPLHEVEALLQSRDGVSVGASNGPHTTVISGDSKAIEVLLQELAAKEIYCRQIKVDVASHSAQVDPILDELFASLSDVHPQPARIPMLSTVTGEYAANGASGTTMDAGYWVENLRRSVLFAPAIQKLSLDRHDTFIELSPHPILLPSIEASARAVNPRALAVASLRREKPARATMLCGLAVLYAAGRRIAWERLYSEEVRCVRLPQYPFQRERCWPEPRDPARSTFSLRSGDSSPLLGHKFESSLQPNTFFWETELSAVGVPYLNDHRVLRSAVFPASGHIDMALSAVRTLFPEETFEVRNATFLSAAYIPDGAGKTFQIALVPDGNDAFAFEIRTRADEGEAPWPLRSSGILQRSKKEQEIPLDVSVADLKRRYKMHRDFEEHYARTSRSGLQYGPAFQRIQEAWVGDGECLCRLQNSASDDGQTVIHPTILDACFQAIAHVWPEGEAFPVGTTFLPVAIERIALYRAVPEDGDLFARAALVSINPREGTFQVDLCLLDSAGKVLIDVSAMEVKRVAQQASAVEPLYSLQWEKERTGENIQEKAEAALALLPQASLENWMIFADDKGIANELRASLEYVGGRCTLIRPGPVLKKIRDSEFEVDPGSERDLNRMFQEVAIDKGVPSAVVHLWSLDNGSTDDAEGLVSAQAIGSQHIPGVVQAIAAANWSNPPRLCLVTAGTVAVGDGTNLVNLQNGPMWGIGRTVAREYPELNATLVDLSDVPTSTEARALALRICANSKEDRIAFRGDDTYVARLAHFSAPDQEERAAQRKEGEEYRIEISSTGILDNLALRARTSLLPAPGEVVIDVEVAGLNFIDVTKAMGIYPGLDPAEPVRLGIECSGKIAALGDGVENFKVGDDVLCISSSMRNISMFSSKVCVPAGMVLPKPVGIGMEEAATVPIAYLTAYYSLVELARIQQGDWVLIHSGAGGVGLAAIEIAKWAGAKIIATTGSREKADYLRSLGVAHVLDSRSVSFAKGVMEITQGRGVDIVLNSLTGELQSRGIEVLAPYGRFIELGKKDIYDDRRVGLKAFRNNLSFYAVDLAAAVEERRPYIAEMLREVMRRIESGEWRPLPVQTFSSADPSVPFRFMAQARHIGKIAIRMDRDVRILPATDKPLFSAKATYIITGGLGGVGLTVANWMAENGAGHLVLLSRRAPSAEAAEVIDRIAKQGSAAGTVVTVLKADITREEDVADVLQKIHASGFPLKGIMHAAAVVDDALVADLSPQRFLPVFAPKITGTWNLHRATLSEDLDFFVLFSSIAAVHPQPGMGSYAAANAFLDAFAQYRRAMGKPASSVNWGGWDRIGLARAAGTGRSLEEYGQQGMRNFSGSEALSALGQVLKTNPVQVIAVPFDWDRIAEFYGPNNTPPAFSSLISKTTTAGGHAERSEILDQLIAADSSEQRHETMESYLQEVLARVLKLASRKIDRERPMGSMGLDSLMGLEFVRRLGNSLQIAVPATVVFNYPTIQRLATHLLQRMQLETAEETAASKAKSPGLHAFNGKSEALDSVAEDLSEEDALQALMSNEQRGS